MRSNTKLRVTDDISLLIFNAVENEGSLAPKVRIQFPYKALGQPPEYITMTTEIVVANQADKNGLLDEQFARTLIELEQAPYDEAAMVEDIQKGMQWLYEGGPRTIALGGQCIGGGPLPFVIQLLSGAYVEKYREENLALFAQAETASEGVRRLRFEHTERPTDGTVTIYTGSGEAIEKLIKITHPGKLPRYVPLIRTG